jgi:VCBS repeat-containing protein
VIVEPAIDELPPVFLPQNHNTRPIPANHFVFIDARVPDLDTLLHGAGNDRDVHVLAADRDGLRQIADVLNARAASDLSSIAIVAHGAPGVLTIGATRLGAANLASRAATLAAIGAVLGPEGRIDLYACDLAAGPQGLRFVSEFARQTGVHVAGASHPIGSEAGNGCWNLDVTTGCGAIRIPFTAAARTAHRGVLTDPTIDTQLFYTLNGATDSSVLRLDLDSVTRTVVDIQSLYSTSNQLYNIVIDTASEAYFFRPPLTSPTGPQILQGDLNHPNAVQTFTTSQYYIIKGLAIDAGHGLLYYGQLSFFDIIGSHPYLHPQQYPDLFVEYTPTAVAMAVDPTNQEVFIVDNAGGFSAWTTNGGIPLAFDPGGLTDLAYAARLDFFFQPTSALVLTQRAVNGHAGAILLYQTANNPTGGYTVLYSEDTPGSGPHGTLTHIAIDASHGLYYVTDEGEADASLNGIYVGSLFSVPGTAPTLVLSTGTATVGGLTLNTAPQLLLNLGSPAEAVQGGGTPVAILSGATLYIRDDNSPLAGSDTDALLASATIFINDPQAGDQLYAGGMQSGTLDSGKIAIAWDATRHLLTLSGRDTVAAYTAALNSVGYADLGADTTTSGHAQRHFEFTVNDGQLDSSTREAALTLDRPPTVVADIATADTFLQISHNVLSNDSDPDGDAIVVSAIAGGSVGTVFHATFGDFKLNADGSYTYFAGATADERAALAAAPNGAHPLETLTYTASDGLGGLASTTLTITIDRAMTLTTPASVNYVAGSAPVSLALAGTIGSVDAASLVSSSVAGSLSVAGANFTSGDQLSILSDGTGAGQISLVGTSVFYQGLMIGVIGIPADGHNGAALTIYFNADATVAAAQALLEHLQFSNTDSNPTLGARDLTLQFRDGLGHFAPSLETINITPVTPVNHAPVLHDVAATAVYAGGPAVTLAPGATASDVDNTTLAAATVHISAGTFAADGDVLAVSIADLVGTGIVANYNVATETLTLSGTDTLAHYTQALEHVTFQSTAADPTNAGADATRTVDWQLNDGSATDYLSAVQTTTVHLSGTPPISTPTPTLPPASDFDGDGHSDILWQNADGTPAVWLTNGTSLISGSNVGFNPGSDWHEIGAGDFNGDGKADILWQNTDGTVAEWFMNGTSLISGASVGFNPGSSWHAIGTGDFNGDGKSDILWQNQDGTPAVWLMNGLNILSGANVAFNPGPSWHVIGAGDFDGDGKSDILWQNADGTPAVWLMNGTNLLSGSNVGFNPGSSWHAVGTGDFNGDGKADILWQNTDGTPAVWLMNGTNLLSGSNVGFNPGPSWHVLNTGDYNGDGKSDILWQNTDGTPAVWLMNGTSLISGANVGFDPGSNWHVIPQHHDVLV